MCIHSCPFITPGLRRTPKAKQRHRSSPSRESTFEEKKVDVPEEKHESTGIAIENAEQKVEQPEEKAGEKDESAQKNEEAPSVARKRRESVLSDSRVLSFLFN